MRIIEALKSKLDLDSFEIKDFSLLPPEQTISRDNTGTIEINYTKKEIYFTPPKYLTNIKTHFKPSITKTILQIRYIKM